LQVSIFLLVAIVFTGAGFGYWMVRRFILSKDGSVDAGIAQFVKWAMRVVATLFIMQVWFLFSLIMLSILLKNLSGLYLDHYFG